MKDELQCQSCSPTGLFYQGKAQSVHEWLSMAISRGLHQGKNSLLELTKQICCFLQSAPEQFTLEEIPITESKVSMDVNFSGSSPAKRVNSKIPLCSKLHGLK
nr:probable E3 ubiquitin-protein ligase HECTD4 isoform X2 [Danio rerio]|eukprot:XP_017208397.1 probable E3 ubiquitin-protein ligase HECTD4 isoform X2 [Danio rerio]